MFKIFLLFNCKETGGINKLGLMKRKGLYNGIILIEATLYYYKKDVIIYKVIWTQQYIFLPLQKIAITYHNNQTT